MKYLIVFFTFIFLAGCDGLYFGEDKYKDEIADLQVSEEASVFTSIEGFQTNGSKIADYNMDAELVDCLSHATKSSKNDFEREALLKTPFSRVYLRVLLNDKKITQAQVYFPDRSPTDLEAISSYYDVDCSFQGELTDLIYKMPKGWYYGLQNKYGIPNS